MAMHSTTSLFNRLIAKRYPSWCTTYKGGSFLRLPGDTALALECSAWRRRGPGYPMTAGGMPLPSRAGR